MLQVNKQDVPRPKCFFTSSTLPTYLGKSHFPTRKSPFPLIASQAYYHTLDVLLQGSNGDAFKNILQEENPRLQYAQVRMTLGELIEGEFFNQYIKTGNILMVSEARRDTDNAFSLVEGVLRLEVDKPTYERLGLQGLPIPSGGRKHVKARFAIEQNLRLPSMVHGRKGFDRIVWAFKNVLTEPFPWLFYDVNGSDIASGPLIAHQPAVREIHAQFDHRDDVTIPAFPEDYRQDDQATSSDLLEWISLALHGSPRTSAQDRIDPHLSRYKSPILTKETHTVEAPIHPQSIVRVRWHGFLPSKVVKDIFLNAVRASGDGWFVLSATGFLGNTCTILQDDRHTSAWEYKD